MELFKRQTHVNFMRHFRVMRVVSLAACIISLGLLFGKGLNFGLEFTGGTQVELRFAEPVETEQVSKLIETLGLHDPRVRFYGSTRDILIRVPSTGAIEEKELGQDIKKAFSDNGQNVSLQRVEFVGSEVGEQMAQQGGLAVILGIMATMVYIALRFQYRLAVSAAVALVHDALIVLGVFSFFQIEFDLASLAAILAIVGYSLNDTIVVFDRVRENFRKLRRGLVPDIMNISINQTLSRTIMTSWLTLLVVLALLVYGGSSLFGFSLVLTIGIVVGTYSSIYVAGSLAVSMGLSRSDMLSKSKEQVDDLP